MSRALEALFDFSPHSVEHSLSNYSIYYSSPIEFVFDSATKCPAKATREDVFRKGRGLITNVLSASVLLSIMEACSYEPFETNDSDNLLSPKRLVNNLFAALLTCATSKYLLTFFKNQEKIGSLIHYFILSCLTCGRKMLRAKKSQLVSPHSALQSPACWED